MPLTRPARPRMATNENDENIGSTRLTRAKAAAALETGDQPVKRGLQSKKATHTNTTTTNAPNAAQQPRKRAALGDVSNVNKPEILIEGRDMKKAVNGTKLGLVSKAAHTSGIQKISKNNTTSRPILASKDHNKKATTTDLKRSASGSGVLGGAQKKRITTSTSSQNPSKEDEGAKETATKASVPIEVEPVKPEGKGAAPKVRVQEAPAVPQVRLRNCEMEDVNDPLMVTEYVHEIFDHLRDLEDATMPNADYMDHQVSLEWKMRGILVDWLIEVHTRFHLLPETLFLTVNIIDRFLSSKVVPLERLQLVGVTAMFIASKYEEVLSPHVANFRNVADDGFTDDEILCAERYILSTLNYDLSYPNPMNFLRRVSKADQYDIQTRTLGKYLMEISLLDHRFMAYPPSQIAAAAMYMARMILERGAWDATLCHYAGYTEEEVEPLFMLMIQYLARPVTHEAFFKKYASKKFLKASILTRSWAKRYLASYADAAAAEAAAAAVIAA